MRHFRLLAATIVAVVLVLGPAAPLLAQQQPPAGGVVVEPATGGTTPAPRTTPSLDPSTLESEHATPPFSSQSLTLGAVIVVAIVVGVVGFRTNRTK